MEYNKLNYQKANDKKVLHKIRKHWVVVSTALLMALGGGAVAATHVSANADATNANNGTSTSSVNTLKSRLNQQLQTPQQSNNSQSQATVNNSENNSKNITSQAEVLHNRIMMNAGRDNQVEAQANGTSQNTDASSQGRVSTSMPKVNNNGVNVGKVNDNGVVKQNATANNGGVETANDNNNKVMLNRRPKMLLGTGDSGNTSSTTSTPTPITPANTKSDAGVHTDSDGLFTTKGTQYQYDTTNGSFYVPYQNYNDPYGNYKDYGEVTVEYVDQSDGNRLLGSASVQGPVHTTSGALTAFGDNTTPTTNNVEGFMNEIPQVHLGDGDDYGYSVKNIDSGYKIGNYMPGENQFLVINVTRNQAPAGPGTITINYIDASSNNHVLSTRVNSDANGANFSQSDYTNNIPQDYNYQKFSDGNPKSSSDTDVIKTYKTGNQTLNIYVLPKSYAATATVIYQNADTKSDVETMTINGTYGSTDSQGHFAQGTSNQIPYTQLQSFVPSGYTFDQAAQDQISNNPTYFGSQYDSKPVYIELTKNPYQPSAPKNLASDFGTITVHYRLLGHSSDVKSLTLTEPNGTSFNASDYGGVTNTNSPYIPYGYTYNQPLYKNIPSKFENSTPGNYIVYVNKNSNINSDATLTDYIEYDVVSDVKDSKGNVTSVTEKKVSDVPDNPFAITGKANTPIDYSKYTKNIPSKYTFWMLGSHDPDFGNGEINHILLQSNNSLIGTTMVFYYDQEGHLVNTPSDNLPISAHYGDKFTAKGLASGSDGLKHALNKNYTLDSDEQNQTYQINSDAQNINLLVTGKKITPNAQNYKEYQLLVNANVVAPGSTKVISTKQYKIPFSGQIGNVTYIDPSKYVPAPSSAYSMKGDSDQQIQIVPEYKASDGGTMLGIKGMSDASKDTSFDSSTKQLTVNFTYTQNDATATILYEEPSDGDKVVGTAQVSGTPGSPMSNYYTGTNSIYNLDKMIPYGYNFESNAQPNALLTNGTNYVINVSNANLACGGHNSLSNQGYINIVYGQGLETSNPQIYSTVTKNATVNSTFNSDLAKWATNDPKHAGWMPDTYILSDTQPTNNVSEFKAGTPQTYYVDVDLNTNMTYQPVTDVIDYRTVNAQGQPNTGQPLATIKITGMDGSPINYTQYQDNLPQGYAYYGQTSVNTPVYSSGWTNSDNPAATIYVMTAQHAASNNFPGYNPNSDINTNDGTKTTPKANNNVSDGSYFPFKIDPSKSDAPLDGGQNPHHPITSPNFNGKDMPSGYDNDSNGDVPAGYIPAWVPDEDAGQNGAYHAGYVPSDNIPTGYIPGLVPNGEGGYVAGYVPSNPSDMPQPGTSDGSKTIVIKGKNGQNTTVKVPVKVPSYVAGKITNGDGSTTPAFVPNIAPYATDTSGVFNIQYIDANSGKVISDFPVYGRISDKLDLNSKTGANKNYMNDLPYGYDNASDEGIETGIDTTTNKMNHNKSASDQYQFPDQSQTIDIDVKKMATGNIIYEDLDNDDVQVGSTQINGDTGDSVASDFTSNSPYMQLLPYNYQDPTVSPTGTKQNPGTGYTNPTKLYNGATYVIGVHEAKKLPETPPQANSDDGTIVVNYVNSKKPSDIVGTESFVGKISDGLPSTTDFTSSYVPNGYVAPSPTGSDMNKVNDAKFSATPQVLTIKVDPDSSSSITPKMATDVIGYSVVTSDGNTHTLVYSSKTNHIVYMGEDVTKIGLSASDTPDSANPVTFNVQGQEGSAINYTPYQMDVPAGYEYDGMGNYSSTFDEGHQSVTNPDTVLLRTTHPQISEGTVNIQYVTLKKSDASQLSGHDPENYTQNDKNLMDNPANYNPYDTISVSGLDGSQFDLGYFENDVPAGNWQYYKASSDIVSYEGGKTQSVTIYAVPKTKPVSQYGTITVHFVKSDGTTPYPGSTDEVMSGHVGDLFNLEPYEKNTPKDTTFDKVVTQQADLPSSFGVKNQDVYIAVDPISNGGNSSSSNGSSNQ